MTNGDEPLESVVGSDDLPVDPSQSQVLVAQARDGDRSALGRLLEKYREFLQAIAERELDPALRAKIGGSDVVQETFTEAHRDFPQFRGVSAPEFHNWLLQILGRNLQDVFRRFGRQKRDVDREVRQVGRSSAHAMLDRIAGNLPTPSRLLHGRERDEQLETAIAQLSDRHREAVELRHRDNLSFVEMGDRLGLTEDAARKLWARAIHKLQKLLEAHDGG